MKPWRAILGLICLLGVALVFYQTRPTNPETPAPLDRAKDTHETSPRIDDENLPLVPVAEPLPGASTDPDVPQAFQDSLKACAPDRESSNLRSLLTSIESESEGAKDTQWRTYTLTWDDGRERRVMVTPKDGANTKYAWEVKFFSVDGEGLPVVEPLPANVEGPEDLSRLLSMGEVRGSAEAYQLAVAPGQLLMVEKKDGKIVDFQWRHADRSMLCSVERCRCLK